jgi:hypothetical protein
MQLGTGVYKEVPRGQQEEEEEVKKEKYRHTLDPKDGKLHRLSLFGVQKEFGDRLGCRFDLNGFRLRVVWRG